jgi:hypothetical protein
MKKAMAVLAVLSLVAFAGQVAVDLNPVERDGDWLVYDDGSTKWLTWGGTYRGVWFNIEDFIPGGGDGLLEQSEFWFYHHSSYPWDTSDVYLEIWNGDAMGPMTQMDQTMVTAIHYAPVYASYSPEVAVEENFWALANTEMSAGGWPAILGDGNAPGTIFHSFFSDDFIVWEPWDIGGACNYFIAVNWNPGAFDNTTWGSLKATF